MFCLKCTRDCSRKNKHIHDALKENKMHVSFVTGMI
uniref:Uncharacterized protein n=1 Tax=Setaria italica TaxID=4555 RepID=K3YF99_SETIT